MKNYIFLLLLVLGSVHVSSCENWLDVQPKTEIKQDKLFEKESGFKDALMGVYVQLGDKTLYGKELSMGLIEVLAQQYEMTSENSYYSYNEYLYLNTKVFDAIWSKTYRVIANVNSILNEIDDRKEIFHPTNYGMIKGEALALRAFLHLDLLRMFGWGYLKERPELFEKKAIPYVAKYHKSLTPQSTIKEVMAFIVNDLKEAEQLLGKYDPMSPLVKSEDYDLPNADKFYTNRISRFNYWAVIATLARAHMWEGNYEKAYEYAYQFVGDGKPFSWVDVNRSIFVDEMTMDTKLQSESIFVLSCFQLYENIRENVEQYTEVEGTNVKINNNYFFFSDVNINKLYEMSTSDWRFTEFFNKENERRTHLRHFEGSRGALGKDKIVMLRIAEMFYYAAECAYHKGDYKTVVDILNQVRISRGIDYTNNLPEAISPETLRNEIIKEWKKEFIGDGVMFYFYKRLNLTVPRAIKPSDDALFVFPLPMAEIETGGREDNVLRPN